jgi:hypothetical protein
MNHTEPDGPFEGMSTNTAFDLANKARNQRPLTSMKWVSTFFSYVSSWSSALRERSTTRKRMGLQIAREDLLWNENRCWKMELDTKRFHRRTEWWHGGL